MVGSATFTRLKTAYEKYRATQKFENEDDFDHESFLLDLHDKLIGTGEDLNPEIFPELGNISSGFMFQMLPVPVKRKIPEFVYVPSTLGGSSRDEKLKRSLAVSEWNVCWEAAQLRNDIFGDRLPEDLGWIRRHSAENICHRTPKSGHGRSLQMRPPRG